MRENTRTCIIATAHQRFLHSGDAKDDGGISSHGVAGWSGDDCPIQISRFCNDRIAVESGDYPYSETALVSWNCIVVPRVTSMSPATTPRLICCAVCVAVAGGWTLSVLIATLRPFTEIDVSCRLSGADRPPAGLELEPADRILPVTSVPALNRVAPLTTTSWSTRAVKVLPAELLEEI